MKKPYLLTFLVVFVLLISGCNLESPVRKAHVTILTSSFRVYRPSSSDVWTAEIEGTAINDGDYDLRYAEVVGEIYTEWVEGERLLDKSGAYTALNKGEEWRFLITCHSSDEPHYYKVWVRRLEKL